MTAPVSSFIAYRLPQLLARTSYRRPSRVRSPPLFQTLLSHVATSRPRSVTRYLLFQTLSFRASMPSAYGGEATILEGVTAPLMLGDHAVNPPVVLAPMAGITNVAFRQLCREQGGGVYVCEMITTRALVERIPKTLKMVAFADDEKFRSLQLYGVDPDVTAAAVRMVGEDGLADHVDLNFGCPVPKVTRRGGGSALPWRRRLFSRIVSQ